MDTLIPTIVVVWETLIILFLINMCFNIKSQRDYHAQEEDRANTSLTEVREANQTLLNYYKNRANKVEKKVSEKRKLYLKKLINQALTKITQAELSRRTRIPRAQISRMKKWKLPMKNWT